MTTLAAQRARVHAHQLRWAARALAALAVAAATVAIFYLQAARSQAVIHDAQMRACMRGNVLRAELRAQDAALEQLMREAAADARARGAFRTADAYGALVLRLHPIVEVDCAREVPSP